MSRQHHAPEAGQEADSVSRTELTSVSLLEALGRQCDHAQARFVAKYGPRIERLAGERGLSRHDAEDLAVEVCLEVFRRAERFRRQRSGSFRRWLGMLVRSRAIDQLRRDKLHRPLPVDPTRLNTIATRTNPPGGSGAATEPQRQVLDAVRNEFSDRDWGLFVAVVGGDLSADEVARDCGVSRNTVYLAKSRIVRRARELFADLPRVDAEAHPSHD